MRTTQPEGAGSAEGMVGRRIGIWWDNDAVFFYGTSEGLAGMRLLPGVASPHIPASFMVC